MVTGLCGDDGVRRYNCLRYARPAEARPEARGHGKIGEKSGEYIFYCFPRFFEPRFCENIRGGLAHLFGPV